MSEVSNFSDSLPLVSVVIPFYSNVNWLVEALDSIVKQQYETLEIIIVDDGSAYGKELNSAIKNKNYQLDIRIIRKKNGGPAAARNLGMIESQGKYIAFMDSDDIWLQNKLKIQIALLEKNGSDWSQHSYYYLGKNGSSKLITTSQYTNERLFQDSFISLKIQTSTVVVRTSVVKDKYKLKVAFPENQRFGEDIDFYRQLSNKKLESIETPLSYFRLRKGNAGFQAKAQLEAKSSSYKYLLAHDGKLIPKSIKIIYSFFDFGNGIIKKHNGTERSAKLLYVVPYLLLKLVGKVIK